MPAKQNTYPDVSDLLARKAEGRRVLASKSYGEKIKILNDMRRRAKALRAAGGKSGSVPANTRR